MTIAVFACATALLAFAPPTRHVRTPAASRLTTTASVVTARPTPVALAPVADSRRAFARMGLLDTMSKVLNDPADSRGEAEFSKEANDKLVSEYLARVERINALEPEIEALDDAALRAKTAEFRERLAGGATLDSILEEAFAVVREASWRALGLRHYDVQLVGGMALAAGKLAEMATGEGKTLVGVLAAYLYALEGKGAHVVTCSEYLARRDAELMGNVYTLLGLSVGIVGVSAPAEEKRDAYNSDVTYVTNSELGFDYLRDNLATDKEGVVLRGLHFCIVDEADSILIDEARTPLIIADSTAADTGKTTTAAKVASALQRTTHYKVSEKEKLVELTTDGIAVANKLLGVENIFDPKTPWAPYIVNALKAKELYKRDEQYIVEQDAVAIVDEFTGRVLAGRRWGDGLQQAVEASEGVSLSNVSQVIATVTYQSLFTQYATLAGMSGTATQEFAEFDSVYGTTVVSVPTAAPVARRDYPDVVFVNKEGKRKAFVDEVKRMHEAGRPVLVGTASIADSEELSDALKAEGIEHEVLNARADIAARESLVIAQAGRAGAVTISTNMAGRGTDILLGGNPAMLARMWLTNALADALDAPDGAPAAAAAPALELPADVPAEAESLAAAARDALGARGEPMTRTEFELALSRASSDVEVDAASMPLEAALRAAYRAVKATFADALAEERETVISLGGLHVVGTQRHESRRIDAQLRGRAGRQGDPGSSRFILSLDDEIFRVFGGDKVKSIFSALRLSEDTPVESKQVTETLATVQQKVEAYYRYIRRQLYQYDVVAAQQRLTVYALRRKILGAPDDELLGVLAEQCETTANGILSEASATLKGGGAAAAAAEASASAVGKLRQFFGAALELGDAELAAGAELDASKAQSAARAALERKAAALDGARDSLAAATARYLLLVQLDTLWKQHIADMRSVQDMVGLRSVAGLDPLIEFREETSTLYERMLKLLAYNTVFSFFQYTP